MAITSGSAWGRARYAAASEARCPCRSGSAPKFPGTSCHLDAESFGRGIGWETEVGRSNACVLGARTFWSMTETMSDQRARRCVPGARIWQWVRGVPRRIVQSGFRVSLAKKLALPFGQGHRRDLVARGVTLLEEVRSARAEMEVARQSADRAAATSAFD